MKNATTSSTTTVFKVIVATVCVNSELGALCSQSWGLVLTIQAGVKSDPEEV
jgi:hypothetical protein